MNTEQINAKREFITAGWMWLVYLILQLLVDLVIYAGRIGGPILTYHTVNITSALIFLGLAFLGFQKVRSGYMTTFLILIISLVPILLTPLFGLRLPQAPLSNIEGMALRQLPVLMIGLILVAWNYNIRALIGYTVLIGLFELSLIYPSLGFEQSHSMAFIFTIVIRTVCFLVVGYFINRLITSLREQRETLRSANQQLTHYASTLENLTISRERNRLSRELHDTVVHTLSGLSVQLETTKAYLDIDKETAGSLLDQSLESTRMGLTETRRALKSMRASPLEDLGLVQAIQQISSSAAQRAHILMELDLPENDVILPPDVEQCVYRIIQEAVENVVHHANAKKITIKLSANQENLLLKIQDDGIGFDPKSGSPNGHFGITGMVERAQIVGGELSITSKPKSGTTVQFKIKDYLR